MRRPTWTDPDKDKESQAAASDDASDDDGIDRNPCKFPDLLFAIAFSAMVVAMIYAAFYYQYAGRVDFDDLASEDAAGNLFSLLIACYASAAVVSQLVASIALRSGTSALDVLLGASNALTLAGSVLAFIFVGPWTGCGLLAVFLVGGAFQVFGRSDRSEFAAATVAVGCDAALEYPEMGCEAAVGLEGGAFFLTVVATLLFGTFSVAAFGYYAFEVQKSDDDDWDTALFLVCLAFAACFFWASQVLKYVITAATASTANSWWFGKDVAPLSAFCRAVTYHYGAICFGALVVAPIESIATSINSMKRMSARAESGAVSSVLSGCLCCVTTVLQCCESILDYFNKFAFVLPRRPHATSTPSTRRVPRAGPRRHARRLICVREPADRGGLWESRMYCGWRRLLFRICGSLVEHQRRRRHGGLRRRTGGRQYGAGGRHLLDVGRHRRPRGRRRLLRRGDGLRDRRGRGKGRARLIPRGPQRSKAHA